MVKKQVAPQVSGLSFSTRSEREEKEQERKEEEGKGNQCPTHQMRKEGRKDERTKEGRKDSALHRSQRLPIIQGYPRVTNAYAPR